MSAGAPHQAHDEESPGDGPDGARQPGRLADERRLLVESLTAALARVVRPDANPHADRGTDADEQHHRDNGHDANDDNDDNAESAELDDFDEVEGHGEHPEIAATVGCGSCGCRAPSTCAYCPVCRTATSLDPQVVERVADAVALLAEGLRAAADRLAAMDRATRDRATRDRTTRERTKRR